MRFSDVQRNRRRLPLQLLSEAVQEADGHGQRVRRHQELVRGAGRTVDHPVPGGVQQVRVRRGAFQGGGVHEDTWGQIQPAQVAVHQDAPVCGSKEPVRPLARCPREDGRHDGPAWTQSWRLSGELWSRPGVQRVYPEKECCCGPMLRIEFRLLQQQQGAGEAGAVRWLRDEGREAEAGGRTWIEG